MHLHHRFGGRRDRMKPNPAVHDPDLQTDLLDSLAHFTGLALAGTK
jgi:hypothetical protein